ncbi:hypothetical protein BKA69DRAFT_659322 [Paraphysoderma sedebokerense]|nr:hypothetical protein BKA69DRAFT_659322 [Paraphysoderma sedebokerense]
MVGITRIYDQQYHFYFSDVNNVVFRLKRSLAALGGTIGDVNMPIREARIDAITMENDAGIDLSVKSKFGENEILMAADGILADNVVPDIYFDFGWVTNQSDGASSLHTSNGSSVSMASLRQMSHSDTSISLQETKDFDYHLKSGGSRNSGSRLIKSALLQTDLLDHLGDDGGPLLFGDDDFGFLEDEYQPPGTPTKSTEEANTRKKKLDDLHFDVENDHAIAVKRGKKFAADGISLDVEMGLDNDPSFEMSYEDTYNPPSIIQESIGGLVTDEQHDGKESEVSLVLNEAVGPHDAEAGQKKQRKRKKGTYKDLMDGVIELSHEEMRSLAQNARIALDEAKAKAQEKAMMKEAESTFNRAFKSVIGMHGMYAIVL